MTDSSSLPPFITTAPTSKPQTLSSESEDVYRPFRGWACCSRPHGNYVFIPSLFTTVAFCLSMSSHQLCNFVSRNVVSPISGNTTLANSASLGFWSFQDPIYSICYYYPPGITFDDKFISARALATTSTIIGGVVMMTLWWTSCIGMGTVGWVICGFLLLATALFEGLTFLFFTSSLCHEFNGTLYTCSLNAGSRCGIAAIVFWFLAAIAVIKTPPPAGWPDIRTRTHVTETIMPDGTRVIEKSTFYDEYY